LEISPTAKSILKTLQPGDSQPSLMLSMFYRVVVLESTTQGLGFATRGFQIASLFSFSNSSTGHVGWGFLFKPSAQWFLNSLADRLARACLLNILHSFFFVAVLTSSRTQLWLGLGSGPLLYSGSFVLTDAIKLLSHLYIPSNLRLHITARTIVQGRYSYDTTQINVAHCEIFWPAASL